ncbi:MAG: 3-hydroxyacyl-CoA dehydrogenase NAD-binding domain-containing protein [Bacteriovoracaceae bacterium]
MNINKVLVIGAGTMGSGIAWWFSSLGIQVHLQDESQEQLEKAKKYCEEQTYRWATKNKLDQRITQDLLQLVKFIKKSEWDHDYDLVIEAIIENLEIKKNLFKELDEVMDKKTVIASNTSSFPIALLSQDLSPERKVNFLGLHFFNPAPVMKLVEVISSKDSSQKLANDLYAWFEEKGKFPAHCKDSPGFIVNRVARNFYGEPLRIAAEDDEKKFKEIDQVLKEVGGFRMGPFELMDLIGIDVNYSVTCSVWNAYNQEPRFAPHPLQEKLVNEKRLGRKSKRGFYQYE